MLKIFTAAAALVTAMVPTMTVAQALSEGQSNADANFGKIYDLAAVSGGTAEGFVAGLYVKLSAPLPTMCSATLYGWLLIPATQQHMISLVYTYEARGLPIALVVNGSKDAKGYCYVTQVKKMH